MKRDLIKYAASQSMRNDGESIRSIAKQLHISSSTASLWCRNIVLSQQQREKLNSKAGNTILLRALAHQHHLEKVKNDYLLKKVSAKEIKPLTNNETFLIGIALYWAEGFKNQFEHRVGFCNSDSKMILFMINWFRNTLNIPDEDIILRVEFNSSHESRKNEIEKYWSDLTKIPLTQFNKPYLQKTQNAVYYGHRKKYYGLLRIRIRKSSKLLTKFHGWIEGLSSKTI